VDVIAKVVVTALLAALLVFAGTIKVVGVAQSLKIRDHLGVNPVQWRLIGALELAAVAGVLAGLAWWPIGVAAAIGAALLLLGAIGFHARASDTAADTAPAVIGLGLAVATAILQVG
jgi:DoxX-like family